MRFATTAVVAVLASQATATFWKVDADKYTSPANRDNKCDDKQQGGYDFEDLTPDKDVDDYGGNKFSGFKCKKSPFSKRTFGSKKSFGGSKCISGTVDSGSGPSFGGYSSGFSVKGMKLSVDYDTDVDAYFDMPDGKTCKQTISCKTGGTDYTNKQCGGATKVRFQLPKKSGKKCGLNVHRIDFDCNTKSKDVPKKTPTGYKPSTADVPSTKPVTTTPVGTPTGYTPSQGTPTGGVPSSSGPASSTTLSTVPSTYTAPSSAPSSSYSAPPSSSAPPASSTTANAPSGPSTGVPVPYPPPSSSAPPASSTTANAPSGPSTAVPVPYPPPSSATTPAAPSSTTANAPTGPSTGVPVPYPPPSSATTPAAPSSTTANAPSGPSTGVPAPYPSPSTPAASSSSTADAPSGPSTGVPAPYPSPSKPVGQYPSPPASSTTADAPTGPSSGVPSYAPTSSAPAPTSSAPPPAGCPGIVPSCLNTWMWESGCENNADASCYCKSKEFIEDVMDCIGSWGDNCEEQSKAANYLVGICADYVKDNSALVTAIPKCDASPEAPGTTKTVTYQTTIDVTITSCGPTVTNCPASSTIVTNSVITTSSVIVPSSPAQQVPTNTGNAPAPYPTTANAPSGPAPAPSVPVTTIPYSSVVTVPQTGDNTPSAPVYSTISTTLTVPYVSFSTAPTTPGQTPSVGLYQPIPNPNATPTGRATNPVAGAPSGTGMYTTGRSPSATRPVQYTGAADKHAVGYVAAAVAFGAWFI